MDVSGFRIFLALIIICRVAECSFSLSGYLYTFLTDSACYSGEFLNRECCLNAKRDFENKELLSALNSQIHGQQKATETIAITVSNHRNSSKIPQKALALVFHGPTGVGKSYATAILANFLSPKHAKKSKFYHYFSATHHFKNKDPHNVATYRDQLHSWLVGNVSECKHSIFVFDEVDKLPAKLLDTLATFLDYGSYVDGVDFSHSIFVFISKGIGSQLIMKSMVELKRQGRHRTDFRKSERAIAEDAFQNGDSGLRDSALLEGYLISRFVPFLPLEREHVVKCVQEYLVLHGENALANSDHFIEAVLKEMTFVPKDEQFFASQGCKGVADIISEHIAALGWKGAGSNSHSDSDGDGGRSEF